MVTAVDDGVGLLLAKLEELGIDDNTLIFFLSDNGGPSKNASNNAPLRGHKGDYFEGGVRVPFAVRWPGKIPAGVDYNNPVSSLDILATFAGITEAEIAKERPLDGVNLMPFITGKTDELPHEILFWRNFDDQTLAVRQYNAKAIYSKGGNKKYGEGKLLYNLDNDIAENKNLYKANKKIHKKYKKLMQEWEEELIDPIFEPLQGFNKGNKSKNKAKANQTGGLIKNGSFEKANKSGDGEKYWQGFNNNIVEASKDIPATDGSKYIRIAPKKGGSVVQVVYLEQGKKYKLSYDARWGEGDKAIDVVIQSGDSGKGKKVFKSSVDVEDGQWQKNKHTFKVKKTDGEHRIIFWHGKGDYSSFYIDNVVLEQID